jgi:hypothetical protein
MIILFSFYTGFVLDFKAGILYHNVKIGGGEYWDKFNESEPGAFLFLFFYQVSGKGLSHLFTTAPPGL